MKSVTILVSMLLLCTCKQRGSSIDNTDKPTATIPYLGMPIPGLVPEIFAPGVVSTEDYVEFASTFSPDGREFYFSRHVTSPDSARNTQILVTKVEENEWTNPEPVSFSTEFKENEPHITPDGSRMYFNSTRPLPGKEEINRHGLWFVERIANGWGKPQYFGQGMFASVTSDGTVYYTDIYDKAIRDGIVRRRLIDGVYSEQQRLEEPFNRFNAGHPLIAPDESFILFDAFHPDGKEKGQQMDVYVSFKNDDGSWGDAIDVGDAINREGGGSGMVALTPDGKYLIFSYDSDLYWVSTEIIHRLRP